MKCDKCLVGRDSQSLRGRFGVLRPNSPILVTNPGQSYRALRKKAVRFVSVFDLETCPTFLPEPRSKEKWPVLLSLRIYFAMIRSSFQSRPSLDCQREKVARREQLDDP